MSYREENGQVVTPHEHLIIGTERAGHCVYCNARFTGKDVQYVKRLNHGNPHYTPYQVGK
jgi:hypothetical protein